MIKRALLALAAVVFLAGLTLNCGDGCGGGDKAEVDKQAAPAKTPAIKTERSKTRRPVPIRALQKSSFKIKQKGNRQLKPMKKRFKKPGPSGTSGGDSSSMQPPEPQTPKAKAREDSRTKAPSKYGVEPKN